MSTYYAIGDYLVKITGADFLDGGKSEYIELAFTVLEEITAKGNIPEKKNFTRHAKFYLSEKALPYTNDKFATLGLRSWAQLDSLNGREITMRLGKHEKSLEGEEYEKWDLPFGSDRESPAPIAPSKAKALQAKYGGGLAAAFASSGQKAAPVAVSNDMGASDDDLPF